LSTRLTLKAYEAILIVVNVTSKQKEKRESGFWILGVILDYVTYFPPLRHVKVALW